MVNKQLEKEFKQCPICEKRLEYYELECNEPFTAPANLRFKALMVWGSIQTEKQIICQNDKFVHFKFLSDNSERLVKMLGYDQDEYYKKILTIEKTRQPCEHKDCSKEGFPCFTVWEPDKPIGYYCEDHIHHNGVCPGCHQFLAGCESFDFSESGYCEACEESIREDLGEYDSEDDDHFYDYMYDEVY